jgi:hypothetical protein
VTLPSPGPYEFVILALAAYRLWKLLAEDAILDRPRAWAMAQAERRGHGDLFATWLTCPWCSGLWLTGWVWLWWAVWPNAIWGASVLAASTIIGLIARHDPP